MCQNSSLHLPCTASQHHVAQCLEVVLLGDVFGLGSHTLVVGGRLDVAYHAYGQWQVVAVHHGQLLVQEVVLAVGVVHEHIVDGVAVLAQGHGLEAETVLHDALVHFLAEEHLLPMYEVDCTVGTGLASGDVVVDTVVEDHGIRFRWWYI